ncbi:hypothetical protein BJ508DRAFT_335328 [Ascobolus immersus RN42]|uniref:Uncharacterized protein n=1 Tax=Ascobolus immersus RN42 TaxID=1160509 RepID=A0A3N4HIU6_ASCIM|nr:hypothetical protein BJ508DRAFT_335328 [Ascobolus immersus RN42]
MPAPSVESRLTEPFSEFSSHDAQCSASSTTPCTPNTADSNIRALNSFNHTDPNWCFQNQLNLLSSFSPDFNVGIRSRTEAWVHGMQKQGKWTVSLHKFSPRCKIRDVPKDETSYRHRLQYRSDSPASDHLIQDLIQRTFYGIEAMNRRRQNDAIVAAHLLMGIPIFEDISLLPVPLRRTEFLVWNWRSIVRWEMDRLEFARIKHEQFWSVEWDLLQEPPELDLASTWENTGYVSYL